MSAAKHLDAVQQSNNITHAQERCGHDRPNDAPGHHAVRPLGLLGELGWPAQQTTP